MTIGRITLFSLFFALCFVKTYAQTPVAPAPNWGVPIYLQEFPLPSETNYQSTVPFKNGACTGSPLPGSINFTFTINDQGAFPATPVVHAASGAIATSAVVYDLTTKTLVATLWNSITIARGTYCGTWNGNLDTGASSTRAPAAHQYQIRLLHNNVQYTWDGMVGVTEDSLGSTSNWDSAGSFPAAMSFMKFSSSAGHPTDWALVAGGYNEGLFEAQVFKSFDTVTGKGDLGTVWPLNLGLVSGSKFDFSATDGNRVYFGEVPMAAVWNWNSGVVAFTLSNTMPPLGKPALHALVTQNPDGSQTTTRTPITSYGQPPWGVPYIFPGVPQALLPNPGTPTNLPYHFVNDEANVPLFGANSPATQSPATRSPATQSSTTGRPVFMNGIAARSSLPGLPPEATPGVQVSAQSVHALSITGLAVQRDGAAPGNWLAVAQGSESPLTCPRHGNVPPSIELYDKNSGALLGPLSLGHGTTATSLLNPQKMAFDKAGNLWVIDGGEPAIDCSDPIKPIQGNRSGHGMDPIWLTYGRLMKISLSPGHDSHSAPTVTSIKIISTFTNNSLRLSNPVDVAVSALTDHIFVADGGINQQIVEFDAKSMQVLSITGTHGGYGQSLPASSSAPCKTTVDNYTFWLDFYGTGTGVSRPWISIDNEDGLWVGDFTTSRILHYSKQNGTYQYQDDIQMGRWHYRVAVPRNTPTRVFAGFSGFLEYAVDYPQPDPAASKQPPPGNSMFSSVPSRNWLPCFLREEWQNGGYPDPSIFISSVEDFGGKTLGAAIYHSTNPALSRLNVLIQLPPSGPVTVKNNGIPPATLYGKYPYFESDGSYSMVLGKPGACDGTGDKTSRCATIVRRSVIGSDPQGFPTWDIAGKSLAKVSLAMSKGDPLGVCGLDGCDFTATVNGVIPVYSANGWGWHPPGDCKAREDACPPTVGPAYHLGGVHAGNQTTSWHSQLEANIEYETYLTDENRSKQMLPEPSRKVNNLGLYSTWRTFAGFQNMGVNAHVIDNLILTLVSGNWQEFGGQFQLYSDDGMLLGQFGWRANGYYPGTGRHGGAPNKLLVENLAPGNTTNPIAFKIVKVHGDYYVYVTDEGYRAGIQRWHISNLNSIGCDSASTPKSLASQTAPVQLQSKTGYCSF